jgi:hypothetical protein
MRILRYAIAALSLACAVACGSTATSPSQPSGPATPVTPSSPQGAFTLSGIVREIAPNERPLAGARIDIVSGPDAGRSARSDATGFYELTGVSAGALSTVTTLEGFDPYRAGLALTGNAQSDGWLAPVPPTNASGAPATARCKDGTWSWSQTQATACAENGGMAYAVCPGPFCRDLTASAGRK